jgi:hypothetical protein
LTIETETPTNRRRKPRRTVFNRAYIYFHGVDACIDCLVLDLSESGARLAIESSLDIPDLFKLVRKNLPTLHCQTVWREGKSIGVRFIADPLEPTA